MKRAGRPLMVVPSVFSMTVIDMFNSTLKLAESGDVGDVHVENGESREIINTIYIFDIDGTLADCSHRLHLIDKRIHPQAKDRDYNRFFDEMDDDEPIECMVNLCRALIENDEDVAFLTGRPERTRKVTEDWLNENDLNVGDYTATSLKRDIVDNLIMRADDDNRHSTVCKKELINEYFISTELDRALFFEDAPDNVKMMREELYLNVVVVGDGLSFSEGHFEGSWEDD